MVGEAHRHVRDFTFEARDLVLIEPSDVFVELLPCGSQLNCDGVAFVTSHTEKSINGTFRTRRCFAGQRSHTSQAWCERTFSWRYAWRCVVACCQEKMWKNIACSNYYKRVENLHGRSQHQTYPTTKFGILRRVQAERDFC